MAIPSRKFISVLSGRLRVALVGAMLLSLGACVPEVLVILEDCPTQDVAEPFTMHAWLASANGDPVPEGWTMTIGVRPPQEVSINDDELPAITILPAIPGDYAIIVSSWAWGERQSTAECRFTFSPPTCNALEDCQKDEDDDTCTLETCHNGYCISVPVPVCIDGLCVDPCFEDADCDDGDPGNGEERCEACVCVGSR